MLTRHLHRELGRIFREFIDCQTDICLNGEKVRAVDPIRVRPSPLSDAAVDLLPPLTFPFVLPGDNTSSVRVTFSLLPVEKWSRLSAEQKRESGITGGGTVSVLRAGREIALGWYLMGSKRRENYDDWWRCEIAFEPSLDELFGVSYSKQGIRPTPTLVDAISPTLEVQARTLNRLVRDQFANLNERNSTAVNVAEATHHKLLLQHEKAAALLRSDANRRRVVSPGYAIEIKPSADAGLLSARRQVNKIILCLNSNHPFYHRVYGPLSKQAPRSLRQALDLLLLGLARALASGDQRDRASWNRLVTSWSDAAALLLEEG
jgi:hypothetical protein